MAAHAMADTGPVHRFRFRLAPLLRLRSQLERVSRRDLAAAIGQVAGVEHRLAVAAEGLRQCGDQAAGADAPALLARALEQGLQRHRLRLQQELSAAQARLHRAQAEWSEVRRDRRMLEQLQERRRLEWQLTADRSEQRELEELSRLRGAACAVSSAEDPA